MILMPLASQRRSWSSRCVSDVCPSRVMRAAVPQVDIEGDPRWAGRTDGASPDNTRHPCQCGIQHPIACTHLPDTSAEFSRRAKLIDALAEKVAAGRAMHRSLHNAEVFTCAIIAA